jgi:adenylyl-sulfate kinase
MENTVIWLTGLSGAGKTTLGESLSSIFGATPVIFVDGDEIRKERPNLGFSKVDRESNAFHAVYKSFIHLNYKGGVAIVALISPYEESRQTAKKLLENYAKARFIEVYINTPLNVCEARDTKGLYKRAREGKLSDLTGIGDPYEAPSNPDVIITPEMSLSEAVELIYEKYCE